MANNVQVLRGLASRYWKAIISVVTGIVAFIKIYYDYTKSSPAWQIGITIGIFLFVILIIRFPQIALRLTRWILGKPGPLPDLQVFRGPRPYFKGDHLPGRQAELNTCWQTIQSHCFFMLQGESGVGKSSFLNACLIPKIEEKFRVVETRIADDPFGRLVNAFLQKPYILSHEPQEAGAALDAITANSPVVLIIDQSEELFVTVKEETRLAFMTCLKTAVSHGQCRLILSIRNDFLDLMISLCRQTDPHQEVFNLGSFFELSAFSKEKGTSVLNEMLEPLHAGDPLRRQDLLHLSNKLAQELLRPPRDRRIFQGDKKSILPVELQITGMMIELIGTRTIIDRGLDYYGGKIGLLRSYIETTNDYVWRKTAVNGDKALLILRQLVSPARTKWTQTPAIIAAKLKLPARLVKGVLEAYSARFLVRRLPAAAGNDPKEDASMIPYELIHEHLVHVLMEAPQPVLQKARDAEERLQFWYKRTESVFLTGKAERGSTFKNKVRRLFAQPIPISETIRLWRFATAEDDRKMLKKNLRGYGARILAPLLPVMIVAAGFLYWTLTDKYAIDSIIEKAPTDEFVASPNEANFPLLRDWAKALINIHKIDVAFTTIKKIKDDHDRSMAFCIIAVQLAGMGDTQHADSAFVNALAIENIYWDDRQQEAVIALTTSMAGAGEEQVLYHQIQHIRGTHIRLCAFAGYMDGLYKAGKITPGHRMFTEILSIISDMDARQSKDAALLDLAENAAEAGRTADAGVALARFFQDTSYKDDECFQRLVNIVAVLLSHKDYPGALLTWKKAFAWQSNVCSHPLEEGIRKVMEEAGKAGQENDFYRAVRLAENPWFNAYFSEQMAIGLLMAGAWQLADSSMRSISAFPVKLKIYSSVIDSFICNKRLSDARQLLQQIEFEKIPPGDKAWPHGEPPVFNILTLLIRLKDYRRALALAKEHDNYTPANFPMCTRCEPQSPSGFVLAQMAAQGAFEEAYALAYQVPNKFERDHILSIIAIERLRAHRTEDACRLIDEVVAGAKTLMSTYDKGRMMASGAPDWMCNAEDPLVSIAEELVKQGFTAKAMEISSYLGDNKASTCSEIAAILARANKTDSLSSIILSLDDPHKSSGTAATIVSILADSGRIDGARLFLSYVRDGDDMSRAKAALAAYEARKGNFRNAGRIADSCSSPGDKIAAYTVILDQYAAKKSHPGAGAAYITSLTSSFTHRYRFILPAASLTDSSSLYPSVSSTSFSSCKSALTAACTIDRSVWRNAWTVAACQASSSKRSLSCTWRRYNR